MDTESNSKFIRCEEDDPNRCQGVVKGTGGGQCPYRRIEPSLYCAMHGGLAGKPAQDAKALKNYRLQQYGDRVGDFASNPEIKNLREEIGIMRMTLETLLNQLDNPNKLMIYTDKISTLVGQIQRLVEAAQKLEEKNNNLLDRKIVIVIADSIVTLIGGYITDPDQLTELGNKICESIINAASPTNSIRTLSQSNY